MTIAGHPIVDFLPALVGGVLIGVSAALMLLAAGRITGVSGIFAHATGTGGASTGRGRAVAFIVSLPIGAFVAATLSSSATPQMPSLITLVVAGVLVGVGTRVGSGCTSGHGVCGISRLSRRSLVATAIFVVSGIVTVAIMNGLGVGIGT